jgi:anti-anti-sigma factor
VLFETYNRHVTESHVQGRTDSGLLEWCGECCIDSLETPRQQLLRALSDKGSLSLDLSGVTRIDTAGLQMLVAFVLEMRRQNRHFVLLRPSEIFAQSARLAGLTDLFGLDSV